MTGTIDAWVVGSYPARVRPAKRSHVQSHEIKESLPVTMTTVTEEEAPVVLSYAEPAVVGKDKQIQYRAFGGRFFLQVTTAAPVDAFMKAIHEGNWASPFARSNAKSLEEMSVVPGFQVISTERDRFQERMQRIADDVLIVDGIVHKAVPEPAFVLHPSVHHGTLDCRISNELHSQDEGAFRIDEIETMRDAATRFLDAQGIRVEALVEHFQDLQLLPGLLPAFDELDATASALTDVGKGAMSNRDLPMFPDALIQALLDLRKIAAMPREHVQERYDAAIEAASRAADAARDLDDDRRSNSRGMMSTLAMAMAGHAARKERDSRIALDRLTSFSI